MTTPEKVPTSESSLVSKLTPADYNAFVAAAQLSDIRLVKSNFVLSPEGLNSNSWELVHGCDIESAHYEAGEGVLMVSVKAEASGTIGEPGTKRHKKVMTSQCQYMIIYDITGEPNSAAVDTFARRVARFAAYPYFRAHFAELAMQAGLTLPPLPVIKEKRLIPNTPVVDAGQQRNEKRARPRKKA